MNNDTAPATNFQAHIPYKMNHHALDTISLAALIPLSEAVFELSDTPMKTLSRLYELLNKCREADSLDILHLIYGLLGIEYAEAIGMLRGDKEARSYFLYGFTANLGELIEELTERSVT